MAALSPLAGLDALEARLGQELDSTRAYALLDDASAVIRDYCGRDFLQHTETVAVDVCCGVATLPNGPVTAVSAVEVDGDAVSFTWTTGRTIAVSGSTVDVTYSYGWADVPPAIVAVVCQVAGRAYGLNASESGITTESLGSYSVGRGVVASSGPIGLLNAEMAVLDRYKPVPFRTINVRSWV